MKLSVDVQGAKEIQDRLGRMVRAFAAGGEVEAAISWSTLRLQRFWMAEAPVDTGLYKASITPDVARMRKNIVGKVFTNVRYAIYQPSRGAYERTREEELPVVRSKLKERLARAYGL